MVCPSIEQAFLTKTPSRPKCLRRYVLFEMAIQLVEGEQVVTGPDGFNLPQKKGLHSQVTASIVKPSAQDKYP